MWSFIYKHLRNWVRWMLNCIFSSVYKEKTLNKFLAYLLQLDVTPFLKNGDDSDTGFHWHISKAFFPVSKKITYVSDSDVIPINLSRVSVNTENITLFTVLKSCLKNNAFSENCILVGSLQLVEFLSKVEAMVKIITNYGFENFKGLMSALGLLSKFSESLCDFFIKPFLCHQMVVFRMWVDFYWRWNIVGKKPWIWSL